MTSMSGGVGCFHSSGLVSGILSHEKASERFRWHIWISWSSSIYSLPSFCRELLLKEFKSTDHKRRKITGQSFVECKDLLQWLYYYGVLVVVA